MLQQILAQVIVLSAVVYAIYSIVKALIPAIRKEGSSCSSGNCNCSSKTPVTLGSRRRIL